MKAKVNIWAIEKDNSVKLLLLLLDEALGTENFCIAENYQLDCRAVRIYRPDDYLVSAYLYTYGQSQGRYGMHLEFPFNDEVDISNSMDIYEDISFEMVVDLLKVHFDLT